MLPRLLDNGVSKNSKITNDVVILRHETNCDVSDIVSVCDKGVIMTDGYLT